MNPRILKKLSERADIIIRKHGLTKCQRFVVGIDHEGLDSGVRVEDKYGYFNALNGTVGYGSVVGYEEPEWEETDAYSLLKNAVSNHFTRWDLYDGYGPEPRCSVNLTHPASVFKYASEMINDEAQNLKH